MSTTQRAVLRLGAFACLLGVVVLAVVAIRAGSGDDAAPATGEVVDPTSFALPDPGLFGGQVVVYGSTDRPGVRPAELGCRLVDKAGGEQSSAKMSELRVLDSAPVVVGGEQLQPLFSVGSYPAGARVECADADSIDPVAVSAPSTFGSSALAVRAFSAGGALLLLVVGIGGLLLTRRAHP